MVVVSDYYQRKDPHGSAGYTLDLDFLDDYDYREKLYDIYDWPGQKIKGIHLDIDYSTDSDYVVEKKKIANARGTRYIWMDYVSAMLVRFGSLVTQMAACLLTPCSFSCSILSLLAISSPITLRNGSPGHVSLRIYIMQPLFYGFCSSVRPQVMNRSEGCIRTLPKRLQTGSQPSFAKRATSVCVLPTRNTFGFILTISQRLQPYSIL
jgi:hypothetical protein